MINFRKLTALAKATPKLAASTMDSAADKLNQEKLTRRAALRRIGMAGGMAVLGTLTIDDLARVSAKKLEQYDLTRGIAADFKNAGVAFAQAEGGEYGPCAPGDWQCICDRIYTQDMIGCGPMPAGCDSFAGVFSPTCNTWRNCVAQAKSDRDHCYQIR